MDESRKTEGTVGKTRHASSSTPSSKKKAPPKHVLDTSTISNISCSEKEGTFDHDTTITNVTVIEVSSDVRELGTPCAKKPDDKIGKENVKPSCSKDAATAGKKIKKRKLVGTRVEHYSDSDEAEDTIVFMENPQKSIQMNQSTTEEFLRLGSNEEEVAVGIFWDIENVRMPKGLNPAILITKLREKFVDESSKFSEKHFYVVCDAREESHLIMKQLFEFHVRIIHVPRLKANSSDNVIRDLMHEFVGYNKHCRIILISGDCDFSHDIHTFRRSKKCDTILIHNKNAKEALIKSAKSAYLYTELIKDEILPKEKEQSAKQPHSRTEPPRRMTRIISNNNPKLKSTKPIANQEQALKQQQQQARSNPRVPSKNPFANYRNRAQHPNQTQYSNQTQRYNGNNVQYTNQGHYSKNVHYSNNAQYTNQGKHTNNAQYINIAQYTNQGQHTNNAQYINIAQYTNQGQYSNNAHYSNNAQNSNQANGQNNIFMRNNQFNRESGRFRSW